MTLRPLKFRILEIMSDGKAHWNNEIIETVGEEYAMTDDYGRSSINFDLIELASGGLISSLEAQIDEDTGHLLRKYGITDYGKVRASESCFRSL
ncbi:MAG: hypothetical protein K8R64_06790 [Methanosarcinaceae archaeon]|nr:hypothetical protein [Methanosarcinaceae archaeon]